MLVLGQTVGKRLAASGNVRAHSFSWPSVRQASISTIAMKPPTGLADQLAKHSRFPFSRSLVEWSCGVSADKPQRVLTDSDPSFGDAAPSRSAAAPKRYKNCVEDDGVRLFYLSPSRPSAFP
jgi:hypothetical protein